MEKENNLTEENVTPIFEEIRNLERMRKFYICFPIATTVSSQLSWSHYLELIKIEEENKRNFYLKECENTKKKIQNI